MLAFYNDKDIYCCAWLSNLMDAGLITPGAISDASIEDLNPDLLRRFTRVHLFAGIGGWELALNMAQWGDSPVWTGSCPCQPFSKTGKRKGFADERHLWPYMHWLVSQCKPPRLFGEQVTGPDADIWIDLVHADMEGVDYAFGCVPFPAAGIGSPHIRDRNYWVADSDRRGLAERFGDPGILQEAICAQAWKASARNRAVSGLGDTNMSAQTGQQQHGGTLVPKQRSKRSRLPGPLNGFWKSGRWYACADGKTRPAEPSSLPLADGVSERVGRLRAYGNAVVPQAAAEFILAYKEVMRLPISGRL